MLNYFIKTAGTETFSEIVITPAMLAAPANVQFPLPADQSVHTLHVHLGFASAMNVNGNINALKSILYAIPADFSRVILSMPHTPTQMLLRTLQPVLSEDTLRVIVNSLPPTVTEIDLSALSPLIKKPAFIFGIERISAIPATRFLISFEMVKENILLYWSIIYEEMLSFLKQKPSIGMQDHALARELVGQLKIIKEPYLISIRDYPNLLDCKKHTQKYDGFSRDFTFLIAIFFTIDLPSIITDDTQFAKYQNVLDLFMVAADSNRYPYQKSEDEAARFRQFIGIFIRLIHARLEKARPPAQEQSMARNLYNHAVATITRTPDIQSRINKLLEDIKVCYIKLNFNPNSANAVASRALEPQTDTLTYAEQTATARLIDRTTRINAVFTPTRPITQRDHRLQVALLGDAPKELRYLNAASRKRARAEDIWPNDDVAANSQQSLLTTLPAPKRSILDTVKERCVIS